jgi:hypothetical protein
LATITPEHTAQREAAIAASRSFVATLMPFPAKTRRAIGSRARQLSFEESTVNFREVASTLARKRPFFDTLRAVFCLLRTREPRPHHRTAQ